MERKFGVDEGLHKCPKRKLKKYRKDLEELMKERERGREAENSKRNINTVS